MRSILITVMLILTVVIVYNSTVGGTGGTKDAVRLRGGTVNFVIESINP
jgi:hypothetical protein